MFLKYCMPLAIFLGYGLCENEKNISRQLNGTVTGNQTLTRADGPYLVTSDLVVSENATLTIEPGATVNFVPSVGIRVRGLFHAKGTPSQRITFRAIPCGETSFCNKTDGALFYSHGIRLVHGSSYNNGRLELQYNGRWGTVCNDWGSWDLRDTHVACRHLGFLRGKRHFNDPGSGPVMMKTVGCKGTEKSLWDCSYRWVMSNPYSCSQIDVGIECDTLLPYLAENFYWKGFYFEPTNSSEKKGSSSLEYVDIENALEGVNAVKNAPDLLHVTIRDSASGLNVKELAKSLAVVDSSILGPMLAGVNIENSCGNVVIENVTVQNARFGGGLIYERLAVNFCSVIPEKASFPLLLNAAGNHHPVDCSKILRASPGRKISVYLRVIHGSGFELNFTDASTAIKTQLHRITSDYSGKTFKTGSTSILELSFYSKGSSNLEMVVMEDQGETSSLVISNSTFSNNAKSGITVDNLIGNSRISLTTVIGNNYNGLYVSNTHGKISVVESMFLQNKYSGVYITKITGTLEFTNVKSSKNQASGIVVHAGTLSFQMSDSQVEENSGQGLHILNQVNSTINIYNTQFIRNSNGDGVYLQAFRYCYVRLAKVLSLGNSLHGALFTRLSDTRLNFSSCKFDGNSNIGVYTTYFFRGGLNLEKISTSNNYRSGYAFEFGDTNINIESSSSLGNGRDGFNVQNQGGEVVLKDFIAGGNKRNGLWFLDTKSALLRSVYLLNCNVSGNSQYGVLFYLTYRIDQRPENYIIKVANSTVFNNSLGGFMLYPADCGWGNERWQRSVQLLFTGNKVKGNKRDGLDILGPEWYVLSAVLANNIFCENSGLALIVRHGANCYYENSSPFNLQVSSNIFLKNKGENIFFVDCQTLPTKCRVTIRNNTFLDNQRIQLFSSNYIRTKTQAVLAVKGGNVTIKYNSFINPLFSHELAALLKDREHVLLAEENWWGTRDECRVKDRVFDFEDRVELAQIHYYPFLDSYNSTSPKLHDGVRPLCFLRGNNLGGTLNQVLNITNQNDAYRVISDVTILSDGVLFIEGNVTLEFPLKSVFLVQGKVIIKGNKKERVKFLPRGPLQLDIRLVGGPAPWEGVVEIWINSTWMPVCMRTYGHEDDIVCRHLGYEPVNSYYHDPSGKEKIFLHNVRCHTDQGDSITICNKRNWISSSSCTRNVLYVGCKIPFWAGVHLAVTSKESVFSDVEVRYAGFPYRDDLTIPGIAFRVDLPRHVISGVFVSNSASIGFQIMYPDPLKDSNKIENSTIAKTESDGIRLESPFLEFLSTNVVNTKGYGFSYRYNWNALNTHVVKMADATVKKFIDICTEGETFISDSSMVYYLVVKSRSRACRAIITVPPEYTIGLQLLYHNVYGIAFHVYSGIDKKKGTLWDIHVLNWYSRPVWMSGNSSILLDKMYGYPNKDDTVHFLLFLIKGGEKKRVRSPNLVISKGNFSHNTEGGIFLGGYDAGIVEIQDTDVRDSPKNGLSTAFSHVNSLKLLNCQFVRNKIGIKLSSFSGIVNIENTKAFNSTENGLYVDTNGEKTIYIKYGGVFHSNGYGLFLDGRYTKVKLSATKVFFGWNTASSVYSLTNYGCYLPCSSHTSFTNCTFYANRGPVIDIDVSPHSNPWQFDGNLFLNNTQGPVILTTRYTNRYYTPELFVRSNSFLFNFCQDKSVIDIIGGTKVLIVEGNIFKQNSGRSVYVEKTSPSGATIRSNVFTNNSCPNFGVIEIQRIGKDIAIVDNIFKSNKGQFMVFLQSEYFLGGSTGMKNVTFLNNSFMHNVALSSSSTTCELKVSGFTEWRTFFINFNRFSSQDFSKELCVYTHVSSHSSTLQASLNFWGYDDEEKIKERIFDAEDDYEHTFVVFRPYISNVGDTIKGSEENTTFKALSKSFLGGRILSNVLLGKGKSPYTVVSDVTILPEASLSIDPGVVVHFMPGVGMLVLGSLFVGGNVDQPVKFSLSKTTKEGDSLKIRLTGGKFPWEGRVEILHNWNWTSLCFNETQGNKTNDAKLICEHLGYQAPLFINHSHHESSGPWDTFAALQCKGSESDLAECSFSFQNLSCNMSCHLVLNCGEGRPWGNVRFLREARNTSNLSTSSLKHLTIEHCGERHGQNVAAIEMIQYVPEVNHVTVLNCSSGGIKVWFPEKEVIITNSSFVNTGGNGIDFISTKNNVTLKNVKSIENEFGLIFHEAYGDWIDVYGKVNLCSPRKVVNVMDHDVFLYFTAQFMSFSGLEVWCEIKVQTDASAGFAIQLLVLKNARSFWIELPNGGEIFKSYGSSLGLLLKRNLMEWNSFTVHFNGWYSSEMLLQVRRVDSKDIPCTFDRGFCDWRRYPVSRFGGVALNKKWYYGNSVYDHTYSGNGGVLHLWQHWFSGYAAFTSPSISSDNNYCYLVFYYKRNDRFFKSSASLSIFLIEDISNNSTLLSSMSDYVTYWKKTVIELPYTNVSYSIVILGYEDYRTIIQIDDLAFVSCDASATAVHQVTGSVFRGNEKQGIHYTTIQSQRHIFRVERCQVTSNGLNPVLSGSLPGAIHLNALKQVFQIVNNYIAGNDNGGIHSKILNEVSTTRPPVSHIHANTIEYNKGGILRVEGVSGPYMNVNVSNNYFSQNFARDLDGKANSVCVITKLWAIVQGNFFYRNVGHNVLLYDNSQTSTVGLRFVNNTLYKNGARGLSVNHGTTILCNGRAEIHGNVLQNPNNRYQFSTTMRGSPITVNATFNWWGENVPNLVSSLIMDKTTDYRLSITVVFQPFVKLPPQRAISVSCPPQWIKDDEMCYMYKGGSFTFTDAEKYCGSYGGNLVTMLLNEDKRLIKHLREEESLVHSGVLSSLWAKSRRFLRESHSGYDQENKVCPAVAATGNMSQVHCDELLPFVCVRRPVIHCPNSCFHNGDCIGATCFCYPGWTGEDCSKFHCHDLHNCSGKGECMGPNVCKCYPGYLGLGCTYSFCGKYESCADCVTDPFCGWCDSSRSCLGGFAAGPPGISCPAWFYYYCYTVGDERCSRDIMRVNCRSRHCNFKEGGATIESCQKCSDLQRCHKITDENQCRSWNETKCPGGKIKVNYTDPQRRNNVEFAKNVKFVEPNETLVYACPVILPNQERASLVLVAPKVLKVQKGDILCSPQAGGIMHKIVKEISDGPFQLMLSAPAGLEEVIKYADFKDEVTAVQVDDGSTFEDEPDQDDLRDVITGNITLDDGRVIALSNEIYKCLGHTYDTGNIIVHSFYLVIEKNDTIPKKGDIVVSNTSDGFIETVVKVHRTNSTDYLETKFQRCEASSHWKGTRLQESKKRLSGSVSCSGGDNNEGLVLSKPEDGDRQFFVNDSIIGRPSGAFIAKVVEIYSSGDFLLVEVISAKLDGNGTITTAVDINILKSHNRRSRRSTRYDFELASFKPDGIHHKLLSTESAKVQVSLGMFFQLTMFLEIETKWLGGMEDATVGLELEGKLDFSLEFSIDGELRYNKGLNIMKGKQLGRSIYIPVGPIKIPAGIFLEITGYASAGLSGKISRSLSVNGEVSLGGECRWNRGSCHKTADTVTLRKDWSSPDPQLEAGAFVKITVIPKISVKLPAFPKSQSKPIKSSFFSFFDDLVEAGFEYVDLSMAVFVSVPLEAGLAIRLPSSQCSGNKPAELESFYGISGVNLGVSVGFLKKHLTLELPLGYSQRKRYWDCMCPVKSERLCVGPPPPRPRPPVDGNPTPGNGNPKPGNGNPTSGNGNPKPGNSNPTSGSPPKNKKGNKLLPSGKTGQFPCGKGPICVGKRTGPDCTQPDTMLLQNCSGNGDPIIAKNCEAECNCLGGWEGEFCERLIANGGGDPHLETLDGVNFDFFGIGEFWGCKSVKNDFGLQFRFYYYERASLIGGIALKAGRSVVTIMTIKTERVQDLPITRIDGVEMNATSNLSEPIEISNGTVLLDHQRRFSFEAEENSVVLISLQYDAGVTVTIDVRHSRVMKRQYLNILYSPTAAYKGHTEGLCGFMDNNATNDFMGTDGTLYDDAVQFAESWRITDCHNGSGTRDSWSWNSSNFYHDDIMDITYTDPTYIPMYSLDGISQSLLQIATSMCKSLNISDNDLQSCIFDVAITNDTTFTDQETFKRDCPDQCSGKGRCINGTCKCIEGWTGKSCDKGSCLNCSTIHGKCVRGFCVCDLGWEGRSCEIEATCFGVNNCTSPKHGSCKTTDFCQCNPGYIGVNCSIVPTCYDVSNCSGNGICMDFDVCKCNTGWTGRNCAQYSCERLNYCSEHGSCVAFDKCTCDYGWTGVSCALPDCEAVNQCSNKGECISSDKCRCLPGFIGADCGQMADCSHLANCSGQGVCVSTEMLNVSCSCYLGFTGDNCSQPTCTTVNNCSAHGTCVEAEFCKCDFGYIGTDCSNFSCEAVNYCSGNGKCVGYDLCLCNSSWSGRACSVPDCSAVKNCSGQGDCILPNVCSCYPAFDGEYCDQKAKPNINPPRFNQTFYNAAIMENSPVGTVILQIKANDTDSGRNGQIFYAILGDDKVESILTVGGQSGKVYNAKTLDFETIEMKSFNVTMVAADNGYPQKSGIATVQITIVDENDNCPTFIEPPGDLKLEFLALVPGETVTKVSAIDLDSGVNSDITYSLSKNDAFSIDNKTGVVTVVSDLTKKVHHLTVSASDNGDVSCTTDISLTVEINIFPRTKSRNRSTKPFTKRKSETSSTSTLPETTASTGAITSHVPTETRAVPQEGPNYAIIGGSAAGGLLLLLIAVLVIRKCLCKAKTSSARDTSGRMNAGMDFEMSWRK